MNKLEERTLNEVKRLLSSYDFNSLDYILSNIKDPDLAGRCSRIVKHQRDKIVQAKNWIDTLLSK